LPLAQITALALSPADTDSVFLGTEEGLVYRTTGGGRVWSSGSRVADAPVGSLAADPEVPDRVYAGTRGGGLYRSDDAGVEWLHLGEVPGDFILSVVVDRRGPGTTVYTHSERGMLMSSDGGATWVVYLSPIVAFAPPLEGSRNPIAVTQAELSIVSGTGRSNALLVPYSRIAVGAELRELGTSPANPQSLFILASGQGMLRSTDSGLTWTRMGAGLEGLQLRALALSPDDPGLILVGTNKGIYRYAPGEPPTAKQD
jgi:photosystem II stability/assembly factor-like uncharacterized protein